MFFRRGSKSPDDGSAVEVQATATNSASITSDDCVRFIVSSSSVI